MGMNETLKAISDPIRREILSMLKDGKKSAGDIAEQFNLTGATVSYNSNNFSFILSSIKNLCM